MKKLHLLAFFFLFILFTRAAKAVPGYSYTTTVCGTKTASFTNTSTGNIAYLWKFGDPASGASNYYLEDQSATGSPINHTFSTYGTFIVTLYALDSSAVTDSLIPGSHVIDSVKHTISLSPNPTVTLSASANIICIGSTGINIFFTAAVSPVGAYKYSWSPTPAGYTSENSRVYNPSSTKDSTGVISVTVTDTITGCSSTASKSIFFTSCTVVSNFSYNITTCGQFNVNFTNSSAGAKYFYWYFGDPLSGVNDTLSTNDTLPVSHTFSDTGVFNVSLVSYNSVKNKKDSLVKQVHIYKSTTATILTNDTTVCTQGSVVLNGTGNGNAVWSPANGLSTTTGFTTVASPAVTTKYYLTVDYLGCVATDSILVTVISKPDPFFGTDSLCIHELYEFKAANSGYASYRWNFGDGDTANGISAFHSFDTSGTFFVNLTVNNGLCDSGVTRKVTVVPDPEAKIAPDKTKAEIDKATFNFGNNSKNGISYTWDFGDGGSSNLPVVTHTYADTGLFMVVLTAYSALHCSDQDTIFIRVDNVYRYWIPSAFTPNREGPEVNEVFRVYGPSGTKSFEMTIYDAWGQLIYVSTDENTPWEGKTSDGKPCQAGNYPYLIKFKDPNSKRLIFKGIVTLYR
jgi:gliding motility-associated-like protein